MPTNTTSALTFLFAGVDPGFVETRSQQDSLLREIVSKHRGHVFKVLQTGYCIVFASAEAAVSAALETQRALACLPESSAPSSGPVCMALYTGQAQSRDNDYFGPPLNRVARFLAAGHCGQILVSEATENEVRHALPEGARLRDLGMHRLKDLPPERIYQLTHPDLPEHFPPLRSQESDTHNLPRLLTAFVGRKREKAELKRLLRISPLVTLTGLSGVGKTRLALQTAEEMAEDFADGVGYVDLEPFETHAGAFGNAARPVDAEATDAVAAQLYAMVASAVGLKPADGDEFDLGALVELLRNKRLLLVLDTCDAVPALCTEVVAVVSEACPGVRILAAGSEPLRLPREVVLRVPPLTCPPSDSVVSPASLSNSDAARLFLDRAVLSNPAFGITERNATAVATLCRELDGLPLALELAAARAKVLSVEQIVARLPDRFRLLTSPGRSALARHRSLRASLDWSFRRLSAPERALLKTLAARDEPWTEAELFVSTECSAHADYLQPATRDATPPTEVRALHAALVEKGMVAPEVDRDEMYFRTYRTLRLYAKEFSGYF